MPTPTRAPQSLESMASAALYCLSASSDLPQRSATKPCMYTASANFPPCFLLASRNVELTESQLSALQPALSAASNAEVASFQLASASLETAAPEEERTTL